LSGPSPPVPIWLRRWQWTAEIAELPEGPNRDLVSKICQSCHDLQMVFDAAGFTREEWDMMLDEMNANGMNVSPDDRAKSSNISRLF